ncbi:OmpA family protein [Nannocystis bainbridge]|uniref:OmpA family protein n=1 Tax=Nannocystis bainbridge TaxID=2995303 RepID=A0ABT5DNN8_9BACT|nr:OmpA family protein [Nannocystis bainbridge]MDC0715275.1 OmpA family protein [Nannocystis bainbridge]
MSKFLLPVAAAVVVSSLSLSAAAQEPEGPQAGGSVSLSPAGAEASGDAAGGKPKRAKKAKDRSGVPWIKRYRPTAMSGEFGIFAGLMFPARDHELYLPPQPGDPINWQPYKKVAPDIGLRAGFYPLSFLGLELEGAIMPTKTENDGKGAVLGGFRGYVLAQLPYRISPFVLIGPGLLGTSALGGDVDPAIHFGGGVKFYINNYLALRLDVRDNASAQYGIDGGRTHHIEVLLGLSFVLRKKQPVTRDDPDSDGDGFKDSVDRCVTVPGVAPDGCPEPGEGDADGDGFLDSVDACPQERGIAPDGCPEKDRDGDGFVDSKDKCPDDKGIAPDGCPLPDKDKDGIPDRVDKCPTVPETRNNYQDEDGCADEIPRAVTKFTGVIKGIFFDIDKDSIKKTSKATLDNAVKVLKDFPSVKVEISGHTDSSGDRDHNVDLSKRRADAVKKYLTDKGIDSARITTRGAGPDEPIADNNSKTGKAKNRRIEFKLK